MGILELIGEGKYYNIIATIVACQEESDPSFLRELIGEKPAFEEIRKTMNFIDFAKNYQHIPFNPIALTTEGNIYRDHFQVAGLFLANHANVEIIQKKIPCDSMVFDENWASTKLSAQRLSELIGVWEYLRDKYQSLNFGNVAG